jgi:hypothetical protein
VLVVVTLGVVLAGGLMAVRMLSDSAKARFAAGGVPTSFGGLWVESSEQISMPQTNSKDNFGMPIMGAPDKVVLQVIVRLANTTKAAVELSPDRFALRLRPGEKPISVEGAAFESVRLLPGAAFDARVQFPVKQGGEYQPVLLFDDPGGSKPIVIDLGTARFQQPAGSSHNHH